MATDPSQQQGPLDLSKYISGVTDRAYQNWGRGDDQYQWAKDQYAKDRGITDQVTQRALDTQTKMGGWADEDRAFWKGTYKPAMEEQMAFARDYTTPGRMAANRAGAISQSNVAFDVNANNAKSHLASLGIDPASGRYAGLDAGLAAKRAAGAASAGTQSDRQTEMLGQEYLDRAIRTGAALPGQAGNFEGIGLAAGNQAVNAGLATTASGSSTMGSPLQWAGMGNDMYKQWASAAGAQTDAGLKANEQQMKRDEAKSKESSGIGAMIGAGAGILGTIYGGPIGGAIGSKLGSMAGGAFGGSSSGGILPVAAARGGLIRRMRAGGAVRDHGASPEELQDIEEQAQDDRSSIHRGYRPGRETVPGMGHMPEDDPRVWREPHESTEFEVPQSDTYDEYPEQWEDKPMPDKKPWTPNYQAGGTVDNIPDYIPQYAEGGEVDDEAFMDEMDAEMEAEDPIPQGGDQVVTPEMSPSGGADTDDVHALLNEGEFVIPKEVVRWHGEKFFQKLIQKAHDEIAGPQEAEPEEGPPTAMALAPPTFRSGGAYS